MQKFLASAYLHCAPAAGDILRFEGFGAGATLTQLDATTWQVTYDGGASSELLAINNGAAIHASDYLFV